MRTVFGLLGFGTLLLLYFISPPVAWTAMGMAYMYLIGKRLRTSKTAVSKTYL